MGKHVAARPPRANKYRKPKKWGKQFFSVIGVATALATATVAAAYALPTEVDTPIYNKFEHPQAFAATHDTVTVADREKVKIGYAMSTDTNSYASLEETYINDTTKMVQYPFKVGVPLTSPYGPREKLCETCADFHYGQDFAPGAGAQIQAIANGTVTKVVNWKENNPESEEHAGGTYVIIEHNIDGEKIESLYAHMQYESSPLKVGEQVVVGALVGLVGNTGQSTGPHLHLSIFRNGKEIDPMPYLAEKNRTSANIPQ